MFIIVPFCHIFHILISKIDLRSRLHWRHHIQCHDLSIAHIFFSFILVFITFRIFLIKSSLIVQIDAFWVLFSLDVFLCIIVFAFHVKSTSIETNKKIVSVARRSLWLLLKAYNSICINNQKSMTKTMTKQGLNIDSTLLCSEFSKV